MAPTRHIVRWATLLVVAFLLLSCRPDRSPDEIILPSAVRLDATELTLEIGHTATLVATVCPDNATYKGVTWSSSHPTTVSVEEGRLKAHALGKARITVRTEKGNHTAHCVVEVIPPYVAATALQFSSERLDLIAGESATLSVSLLPTHATPPTLTWESTDHKIASVNEQGKVQARTYGQVVITARADKLNLTARCTVNVQEPALRLWPYKLQALPSLRHPRADHQMHLVGSEVIVVGGHTTGYRMLTQAERYTNGSWRELATLHPHDGATSLLLSDGRLLVVGGTADHAGQGHIPHVDLYDPSQRTFLATGLPAALPQPAAYLSSSQPLGGEAFLSGNRRAPDHITRYSEATGTFTLVKRPSQSRQRPYVVRTGPGRAMVFGGVDGEGKSLSSSIVVDRVQGDPLMPTALEGLTLLPRYAGNCDAYTADYTYLFPALDSRTGSIVIVKSEGEHFSRLPLEHPIPLYNPLTQDDIEYTADLVIDRSRKVAYLVGISRGNYAERIAYLVPVYYEPDALGLCRVSMGISDALIAGNTRHGSLLLLPNGRLLMVGGAYTDPSKPSAEAWLLDPSH